MADDAAMLLLTPRQEAGNVYESNQWQVECVAEADEARPFGRCINVKAAR